MGPGSTLPREAEAAPSIQAQLQPPAREVEASFKPVPAPGRAPLGGSFDDFLLEVEHCVPDAGKLLLFTGKQLRLDILLLRHEKNPRVIWGLRHHEDWAFKATLLRFARVSQPVHLLLAPEPGSDHPVCGWVVGRTVDSFWASPIPPERLQGFLAHCLEAWALETASVQVE